MSCCCRTAPAGDTDMCGIASIFAYRDGGRVDAELVQRVVSALYASPRTRAAIEAATCGAAVDEPRYVTLSEMHDRPPPPGVAFFNDAIGVLTVAAPAEGGVEAVKGALAGIADGIQIDPEIQFHAT